MSSKLNIALDLFLQIFFTSHLLHSSTGPRSHIYPTKRWSMLYAHTHKYSTITILTYVRNARYLLRLYGRSSAFYRLQHCSSRILFEWIGPIFFVFQAENSIIPNQAEMEMQTFLWKCGSIDKGFPLLFEWFGSVVELLGASNFKYWNLQWLMHSQQVS